VEYAHVYIDAYSVIYAWPDLMAAHRRSPPRARAELVGRLTQLADSTHLPVTVVFDGGRRTKPSTDRPLVHRMEVRYSEPGETADAVIERRVAAHGRSERVLVVTNDRVEQMTVESFGAETMSAQGLAEWIERERATLERSLDRLHGEARGYRKFP